MIHRVQVDFEIEAPSHQEAVVQVMHWICPKNLDLPEGTKDFLVLEENEHVCAECNKIT